MFTPPRISTPKLGSLHQGTIFSCARAEWYGDCSVHGIIITARCDLAHGKLSTVTYLPIVRMDDWIRHDFRFILCERASSDTLGTLRQLLKTNGYSPTILDYMAAHSVRDELFPESNTEKRLLSERKKFTENIEKLSAIEKLRSVCTEGTLRPVLSAYDKLCQQILKECVSYRLSGYYFLPSIEPDGDDKGFVVLLREVRSMPTSVASAVSSGLDYEEARAKFASAIGECLNLSSDSSFAMPVGVLRSPDIEHLLQTFAHLFSRVGIEDLDRTYLSNLWERQPSVAVPRGEPKA